MAIIRWLVYSNLWVSLVAPSMLWFSAQLMNEKLGVEFYIFVFSSTLFTYNIQRLYKANDYLAPETLSRHRWIWERQKVLQSITLLACISTLICLFFVPLFYLLWLIPAGLVSALYFIPFYGEDKRKRLRDFPFLKIALVAFVWSWVSVACVALMREMPLQDWIFLYAFQFLFCFGLTIPFDIRDEKLDKEEGRKTFISQWGITPAKIFCTICFSLAVTSLFFFSIRWEMILCLSLYMVWACLSTWFASPQRHELYYGFYLDGFFLFQGPVVFGCLAVLAYLNL